MTKPLKESPRLSFVMLAWNSAKFLERALRSIIDKCCAEAISFEIVLVDNGSTDGTPVISATFQAEYNERFSYVRLPTNSGTTYPRNIGIRMTRGAHVCIIDSDTKFGDGLIATALHRLEDDSRVGILAPKLILGDGRIQSSVKRFPTLVDKLVKIPAILLNNPVPTRDFYSDFPFRGQEPVDSAISACWLMRRTLFEEVGFLDERIFYAPEDLEFCMRVRKAGKQILYWPDLVVTHYTQQISHRRPLSRTAFSHAAGLLYYYRKHGGWVFRPCVGVGSKSIR